MIQFDILSLFPEIFRSALEETLLKKAQEKGLVKIRLFNIRDWALDKHKTADDAPFSGADGMVIKPDLITRAITTVRADGELAPVILLSPQGKKFDQQWAKELAGLNRLILVCGRYAGIDQRAIDRMIDLELSIGDYVLSGGEIPALVVIEAITRLVPGVLGNQDSPEKDSFPARLEPSQYTRPREFLGENPPEVLLSGAHQKIKLWHFKESLRRTLLRRPDLFLRFPPTEEEQKILNEIKKELINN